MKLQLRDTALDLTTPVVMGVLNVTPDSFSDGGRWRDVPAACAQAWTMVEQGARIIDIGGESTRPGAAEVSTQQELDRVLPVIERLSAERLPAVLSIDTSKTAVMQVAIAAGAAMVNDVTALRSAGAVELVAKTRVGVCLMHMQGRPRDMQAAPHYQNVVSEVGDFLAQRAQACIDAGVSRASIVLDPGFGFGKNLQHNTQLLAQLSPLTALGYPLLVGMSRKSMLGDILQVPADQRAHGHSAAVAMAILQGAKIVRVHDVPETLQAVAVAARVRQAQQEEKG